MHGDHQVPFILLSIFVAVCGCWTALQLHRQAVGSAATLAPYWLGATSTAMGLSIFSMHYIAMLGFDAGVPVKYDFSLTLVSLLLAIFGTAVAFASVQKAAPSRARVGSAAIAMGTAICLMHYVGMSSIEGPVSVSYNPILVGASYLIAVTVSWVGLLAFLRRPAFLLRLAGSVVLGLAISSMHYTAMAAATFNPTGASATSAANEEGNLELAIWIMVCTTLLLFLAIAAAFSATIREMEATEKTYKN